jgi:hypothetical protein
MATKNKSSRSGKRPNKSSSKKASLKAALVRDVYSTPNLKQIQTSIAQGKTRTLADFRSFAGW